MLIFPEARLVLFAVPKTGTQALEAALAPHAAIRLTGPPRLTHMTVRQFRRRLQPLLAEAGLGDLRTVAVMREPIDWLGSWFRYRARPAIRGQPQSTEALDFDAFIEGYLAPDPPEWARVGAQARFLSAENGAPDIDYLFPYEPGHAPLATFLEERLGIRLDLPRANVSPPRPLVLSAALEVRLKRERAEDFALWEAVREGFFLPR